MTEAGTQWDCIGTDWMSEKALAKVEELCVPCAGFQASAPL